MEQTRSIGRRSALALVGGAALAAGVRVEARASRLDFGRGPDRLKAYMLMRGALDDRLVVGCVSGRYHGIVGDELTPLFGVISATFARYRPLPSGGYRAVSFEQAYFTDLQTGAVIDTFDNPYTGRKVSIPGGGYTPSTLTISPALDVTLERTVPGLVFDHRVGPIDARANDVWITETTRTAMTLPGRPQPFRYSEVVILHARHDELDAPGAKRVACETSFTNVVGWRPWLDMGDQPGHMMATGTGNYGTMANLPPAWIAATRDRHPELLKDPAAALAPLWNASA